MIDSQTKILGIIGYPLSHTRSPLLHNTAINKFNLNYVYLPFEIAPSRIGATLNIFSFLNVAGMNVTIPYKEKVLRYMDELSEEARLAGAVNTIKFIRRKNRPVKLAGYNTDIDGFIISLRKESGINLKDKNVLLLGAGGAAKAVAVGLALNKVKTIIVANRTIARANKLVKQLENKFPKIKFKIIPAEREKLKGFVPEMDLIVNSTSLGLGDEDIKFFPDECLKSGQVVYDLIYSLPETLFLKKARQRGAKTINGLGMLIEQGSLAFEIWTGKQFPLEMRQLF